MTLLQFKLLQLRGKIRRFFLGKFRKRQVEAMIAQRRGECNRCGACCKILFRCPFLTTDAQGQYTCRIYAYRFTQCRLFPINRLDLREVSECSFTFVDAAEPAAAPLPQPVLRAADVDPPR